MKITTISLFKAKIFQRNNATNKPKILNSLLHTSQWKNLSLPPTLQMPQPSQWYWDLSSSSKRLQIRQVYWKDKPTLINWPIIHKLTNFKIKSMYYFLFHEIFFNLLCQISRRISRTRPVLSAWSCTRCRSARKLSSCWSSATRSRRGSICTCRTCCSMASRILRGAKGLVLERKCEHELFWIFLVIYTFEIKNKKFNFDLKIMQESKSEIM